MTEKLEGDVHAFGSHPAHVRFDFAKLLLDIAHGIKNPRVEVDRKKATNALLSFIAATLAPFRAEMTKERRARPAEMPD